MKLNYFTLAIIVAAAIVFGVHAAHLEWTANRIVGVAIAAPALVLLIVARLQLADAFSVHAQAKTLVTTGLYARIRNPIYVFGALMIAGVIVFAGKPVLFLGLAALIAMQITRSRKESRALEAKFGDAYREYRKKTWF